MPSTQDCPSPPEGILHGKVVKICWNLQSTGYGSAHGLHSLSRWIVVFGRFTARRSGRSKLFLHLDKPSAGWMEEFLHLWLGKEKR